MYFVMKPIDISEELTGNANCTPIYVDRRVGKPFAQKEKAYVLACKVGGYVVNESMTTIVQYDRPLRGRHYV